MLAITGATGQLGQATLRQLATKLPPDQLVAVVRDPQKATALSAQGIHVRQGDYNDPASLVTAFAGVTTVLLVSGTDLAARAQQHRHVIDAARTTGVARLVYTSGLNPSAASAFPPSPSHAATEAYLRASGLAYTIVRDALYLDVLPLLVRPEALANGHFPFAAGNGSASFALRAEIGEALAAVLTTEGHDNQLYDLAPAPAYSMQDITRVISTVTNRPLEYVPVSDDELTARLRQQAAPEPMVAAVVGFARAMAQGEFDVTSPVLEHLLGRRPTSLQTYVETAFAR